jgi:DNA-binding IclR family transcriptional regulator
LSEPNGLAAKAGLQTVADVEPMLAEYRAHGLAAAADLVDPGRTAMSAPIFDHSAKMVAAIAIIGVQGQLDIAWDGRVARALLAAAKNVSRRLGAPKHLVE